MSVFAPRFLAVHVVALTLAGIAGWLGSWQYTAWQVERATQSRVLADDDPVALDAVLGPDDPFPGRDSGRPVRVSGQWLPAATVVISGRARAAGEPANGYWIVTPVSVGGTEAAFPVVLGWTADPADVSLAPTGSADVVALLQPPESGGAADADPTDNIAATLSIAVLVQQLDRDAYGGFGIVSEPVEGLVAVPAGRTTRSSWSTGLRNIFYAVEWWFFGGFALFVWWRYLRDERIETCEPSGSPGTSGGPADGPVGGRHDS
ncbi:MAG: SURF1 family protein [Nocardioides sp.]